MIVVDLFCGIGGFHYGLKDHSVAFACDTDPDARQVYFDNFGIEPRKDICAIPAKDIPQHDILCAGFPCQKFSSAGKKHGKDKLGLFMQVVRIAQYHRPPIILMENVPAILKAEGGLIHNAMNAMMYSLGYDMYSPVLNASNFGIPQARKRVYFVCLHRSTNLTWFPPQETNEPCHMQSIVQGYNPKTDTILKPRDDIRRVHLADKKIKPNTPIVLGYIGKGGNGRRILAPQGHSMTITASDGGISSTDYVQVGYNKIRTLRADEVRQVMGFPKMKMHSNKRTMIRLFGNAVIPRMVQEVFAQIK